eukprot:4880586-Alexandrium_andersonii.AAC.1
MPLLVALPHAGPIGLVAQDPSNVQHGACRPTEPLDSIAGLYCNRENAMWTARAPSKQQGRTGAEKLLSRPAQTGEPAYSPSWGSTSAFATAFGFFGLFAEIIASATLFFFRNCSVLSTASAMRGVYLGSELAGWAARTRQQCKQRVTLLPRVSLKPSKTRTRTRAH